MRAEKFFDAMSELDTKYVDEALNYKKENKNNNKKPVLLRWCATAACAALAVFAGTRMVPQEGNALPMLTLPDMESGGMGFEAWTGYDIAEWNNGNPWSETMEFSTLPVYRNGSYDPAGMPVGLTPEEMQERLEYYTAALGMDGYDVETAQELLTARADGWSIVVYADGMAEVWFEDGLALPEEYSFAFSGSTEEEAKQALDYLSQEYAGLLGFSQPKQILSGSYLSWEDCDENGNAVAVVEYEWEYMLYDAAGDDLEDILNYNYNWLKFYPDVSSGKLSLIRISDGLSCAEKLGDYPVISAEEAYELLLNGNYITSVPYAITETGPVATVELVYRSGRTEETFLPYYRFYAALPQQRDNGLTDYGAYYVPAVKAEYIANMPVWDGVVN